MEDDLNILMIFGIKNIYNFDPYNVFLAIAINIPQRLNTAFVLQGLISTSTIKNFFALFIIMAYKKTLV